MAESSTLRDTLTAARKSIQSLSITVQRFKKRNKTLNNLHTEVESLCSTLDILKEYDAVESSSLDLLHTPIERCGRICDEFRSTMELFHARSNADLIDWGKMRFMRGSLSDFVETLAAYKSTLSVTLGVITLHKSQISEKVIEDYRVMIQDAMDDLKIHVQRINETINSIGAGTCASNTMADLCNERAISEQCIRICSNAKSCVESLARGGSNSQQSQPPVSAIDTEDGQFNTQAHKREDFGHDPEKASEIIRRIQDRTVSFLSDEQSHSDRERLMFQKDLETSKKCLEICELANEATPCPKVFKVVEAVAEGESDQVIVTTLADRFDVIKAFSKGHSTQLIGSMTSESLQELSKSRYGSKFGTVPFSTIVSTPAGEARSGTGTHMHQPDTYNGVLDSEASRRKPTPNEMRRRTTERDK